MKEKITISICVIIFCIIFIIVEIFIIISHKPLDELNLSTITGTIEDFYKQRPSNSQGYIIKIKENDITYKVDNNYFDAFDIENFEHDGRVGDIIEMKYKYNFFNAEVYSIKVNDINYIDFELINQIDKENYSWNNRLSAIIIPGIVITFQGLLIIYFLKQYKSNLKKKLDNISQALFIFFLLITSMIYRHA